MKLIGIYCIRNLINGKCYIGQSINIHKRLSAHFDKTVRHCSAIQSAILKYGKESFVREILELCNRELLSDREFYWITTLNTLSPNGYNLIGNTSSYILSEETRQRQSESLKKNKANTERLLAYNASCKGKKLSKEHCAKIAASNIGNTHTLESRAKMSANNNSPKGDKHPRYRHDLWEQKEQIYKRYQQCHSLRQVAREYHTHHSQIKTVISEYLELEKDLQIPLDELLGDNTEHTGLDWRDY